MKMPALPRIALACQLLYYSSEDGLGKRRYWEWDTGQREQPKAQTRARQTLSGNILLW